MNPADEEHQTERHALTIAVMHGPAALTAHGLKRKHFTDTNGKLFHLVTVAAGETATGIPEMIRIISLASNEADSGIPASELSQALAALTEGTGDALNAAWYAGHIIAGAKRRESLRLVTLLQRIHAGEADGDPTAITARLAKLAQDDPTALPFSLAPLARTCADFIAAPLPPRRRILGNWLFAGDLGAIIASRGSGKTWFTMLIAKAIATGTALGDWGAPEQPLRVGIYDSEMAMEDLHARAASCGLTSVQNILLLSYSAILQARQRPLNLANLEDHALLIEWAKNQRLDVVLLDNLTTSVSGVEENGNDDFRDKVQPLLLAARAEGITLIIVGHLGRNGKWRGASGKEDMLDWTLKLARDEDSDDDRLVVKSNFDKFRRSRDGNGPLRWTIRAAAGEDIDVTSEPFQGVEAMIALIAAGVTKPSELAEELGVTGGCISKWAKKGIDSGKLAKDGREWKLAG